MRKILLFLTLGYAGYSLYNKWQKSGLNLWNTSEKQNANSTPNNNSRIYENTPGSNNKYIKSENEALTFDPKIESQIQRREGLTDEAKVGIND